MRKELSASADPKHGLQIFLLLDAALRLGVWSGAFILATVTLTYCNGWPTHSPWGETWLTAIPWAWAIAKWIIFFNVAYLLLLLVLRWVLPTPKEGRYTMQAGAMIDRQLIWSAMIAAITKARYQAPFPAFLVFHLSSQPLIDRLVGAILGPRSQSCSVTEPMLLDPHLIQVGRNVVFGLNCLVSGHTQGRDHIIIKKTVIEDDVLIGGHAIIYSGCKIGRGGVLLGGAILPPDTIMGENEMWGGIPAKKIKDLPPYGSRAPLPLVAC